MHGDMSLPKNIRTGDCKTGVKSCSQMKADFTRVHVIDVFESGEDPENDMRTVTLWKQTDMEEVSDGMGWNLNGGTLTALRFRDEIVDPIVRPFAGAIGDNFILMQDNARPHTARVCMDCLNRETIEIMDWLARSPDLNPI